MKDTGEFDNTLIMVVSDNGASAEGGPAGTTNELQFFNNAPETLEESLARIDELGGPATFNRGRAGFCSQGGGRVVDEGDLLVRRRNAGCQLARSDDGR